jgi:hypothetical protein
MYSGGIGSRAERVSSMKVLPSEHAGLGDRIERRVAHGHVELAGDQVVALAVHLHPLDAALLHPAGDVPHEGVLSLVVVVVAVEEKTVVVVHERLLGARR